MTDKQIIIDGVDVSGCEYFRVTLPSGCLGEHRCNCDSINSMSLNCEDNNCIYKQLKCKEQECERLDEMYQKQLHKNIKKQCRIRELQGIVSTKEFILKVNGKKYTNLSGIDKAKLFINNENGVRNKKILELENEISSLQWKFYDKCKEIVDAQQQLDQLKAENEELRKRVKELLHDCNSCNFHKFKQTLTEIKEIAETAAKCMYATYSDDYTNGYRWLGSIILQKISECEVEQ